MLDVLRNRDLSLVQMGLVEAAKQRITVARLEKTQTKVAGEVDASNRFIHYLYRKKFALEQVSGDIAELRLHCERAYVGFIYEVGKTYVVDPNTGSCTLILIGDPGTTFALIESH